MKIEIENIAKVKKANIDIEGITVIAGLNGSGKSTIFRALNSMCSSFGKLNLKVANSRMDSISNAVEEWDEKRNAEEDPLFLFSDLPEKFISEFKGMSFSLDTFSKKQLLLLLKKCEVDAELPEVEELYKSLQRVINRNNEEYCHFIIEREFLKAFHGQVNSLENDNPAKIVLQNGKQQASVTFSNKKLLQTSCNQILIEEPLYIETINYLDVLSSAVNQDYSTKIPLYVLLNNKNESITIEQYNKINEAKEICEQIINEVTHGELISTSDRQIKYRENDMKEYIATSNIASGLKNILLIQKILANGFLDDNTLLLIDEPEVNLHPEWQVKFAEILILIYVKMHCKIIINTHSPYFMRAIESKLAEHEIAGSGKYYYMKTEDNKSFVSVDVTNNTEIVYETMYKPLEEL